MQMVIGKAVPHGGYWAGNLHWSQTDATTATLTDEQYAILKNDAHLVLVPIPMACPRCGAPVGEGLTDTTGGVATGANTAAAPGTGVSTSGEAATSSTAPRSSETTQPGKGPRRG